MKKTPYIHIFILIAFIFASTGPIPTVQADDFDLPKPGVMVRLSPEFQPAILKGIKIHPDDPFRFDFILDRGDSLLPERDVRQESVKLIKYFLASLTIPDKDLWVNLSPYEKNRVIPQSFGLTEMGRDLLAEDYMLKQITASLIYPEDSIGKKFWKKVYEQAQKRFGTTNIPVNTFNKVWIVPKKAVVYENPQAGTAYVVESKLKVMLEQDYLAISKSTNLPRNALSPKVLHNDASTLGSQIIREIVIPELNKEVNEGKNFTQLRQVYNSLILATWYKKKIRDSILAQVYENKKKVAGVGYLDSLRIESIYRRYLQAFKKGVYNFIKEDIDPATQTPIPRKYFSGGTSFDDAAMQAALQFTESRGAVPKNISDRAEIVKMVLGRADRAMESPVPKGDQMNLPMVPGSKFKAQDIEAARLEFEKIRKQVNDQDRIRPFVFYHSNIIFRKDIYGGTAMFQSLLDLLQNKIISDHYGLQWPAISKTALHKDLTGFKNDLDELARILRVPSERGKNFESIREFLVRKGYATSNILITDKNLEIFLGYFENDFLEGPDGHVKKIDATDFGTVYQGFIRKMESWKFISHDPLLEEVAVLMEVLKKQDWLSPGEYEQLQGLWDKLSEQYLVLSRIPTSDLGVETYSGQEYRIFDPTAEKTRAYIPDGDPGKFVGEYYENTRGTYALLSKVFFAIATEIEGRDVLSGTQQAGDIGKNWDIRSLRRGYYRDWNNVWQKREYDPSKPPVNFLSYSGTSEELKEFFRQDPSKMIDIFSKAAQEGLLIDDGVLDVIRTVEVDKTKENLDRIGKNFVRLMGLQQKIAPMLVRMHEIGLLDQIFPELAELNGHYTGKIHRFSLSYHTLYLLYYFENGLPELLKGLNREDVYQKVMADSQARTMLRFSMLLHDAQKDAEYQHLGRPHPVEGANSLVYKVLERFPGMEFFSDWIAWLVWHHQDLNARGRYSPPKMLCHSDLLDIITYKDVKPMNGTLIDMWYLLTISDAHSVDPLSTNQYLYPQVHDLYKNLAGYYNSSDVDRKVLIKKWKGLAKKEETRIRDYYRSSMTASEIRSAAESFRSFVEPGTVETLLQRLDNEEEVIDPTRKQRLTLGQLPPQGYFNELYDEYSQIIPLYYLRELNRKDGVDLAHEMVMYAIMRDSKHPDLVLARAGEIETELGNLLNVNVNINGDRTGILSNIMGLMSLLNLNVVNSQVRTMDKPGSDQKIIVDQLEGYFLPGGQSFESLWPKIAKMLNDKKVSYPKSEIYDENGRPDIRNAIPVLLNILLSRQVGAVEGPRVTIDDIYNVPGVNQVFLRQQRNLNTPTRVRFLQDMNGGKASQCVLDLPDRNGLLYSASRIAGEGFGFNIEAAPILTSRNGVIDKFTLSKFDTGKGEYRALTRDEKDSIKMWYQYLFDLEAYDNNYLLKALEYIKEGKSLESFRSEVPLPDFAMTNPRVDTQRAKPGIRTVHQGTMAPNGGIDLTPGNMNLQSRIDPHFLWYSGSVIKFRMDPALLSQLQDSPGFTPVIINIQPMTDLDSFLGIKNH